MHKKIIKIVTVSFILGFILFILKKYSIITPNNLNNILLTENLPKQDDTVILEKTDNIESGNNSIKENKTKYIIGIIEIPKIGLVAEIKEGTGKEVIDYYVGHFKETSLNEGNIGLAAHNRGQNIKSYFAKLQELNKNDIITYKTNYVQRNYLVNTIEIIKDTDFSYLEQTEDNRITLITCINNKPGYRLCIQAVEKTIDI